MSSFLAQRPPSTLLASALVALAVTSCSPANPAPDAATDTRLDAPGSDASSPRPVTNPYPAECPGGEPPPAIETVDDERIGPDWQYGAGGECPAATRSMRCPGRLGAAACFADPAAVSPVTRCPARATPANVRALVYSRERGWCPHPAHCAAEEALRECGAARGWRVTVTADERDINAANLANYDVVAYVMTGPFALTDGDPGANAALQSQRDALQAFVRAGHGFAALHSVTATDRGWPWFVGLTGASFRGHPPAILPGALRVVAAGDPLVQGLPDPWIHCEELHSVTPDPSVNPSLRVLLALDERCPAFPAELSMGTHPVAWTQQYEGGRAFVTTLGHTHEAWNQEAFLRHVVQGIEWAAGQ